MPIEISTKRRRLEPTVNSPTSLTVGTAVESDIPDKLFFPVIASAPIDPPVFTVASSTTVNSGSTVTTSVVNGFLNVKVGDIVTGTGIPASTTVLEKISNSAINLSAPATASGTVTLSFNPGAITPVYYALEVTHAPSSSGEAVVISSIVLHKYDGTVLDGDETPLNSTQRISLIPSANAPRNALEININDFLNNLRVPPVA